MAFDCSKSFFPVWLSIHNDLQVQEMSTNAMGKPVKHFDLITLLPEKYLQKIVFSDVWTSISITHRQSLGNL